VLIFSGAEAREFTKEADKLEMPATPSSRNLEFVVVHNLSQYHSQICFFSNLNIFSNAPRIRNWKILTTWFCLNRKIYTIIETQLNKLNCKQERVCEV
jgi:hypothetical protein